MKILTLSLKLKVRGVLRNFCDHVLHKTTATCMSGLRTKKPYFRMRRNFCYNVLVTFMQNIAVSILNIPDSQREQWLTTLHLKRISTLPSAGGGTWIPGRVYRKLRFLQMSQSKWRSYPSNEIIIIHFINPHLCIISASTISNFSRFARCNIQDTHRSQVCNC